MLLTLSGVYSLSDAKRINVQITEWLDTSDRSLLLVIGAENATIARNFEQVRAAQSFMDDPRLRGISIITTSKLTRLSMMVIFNLSKAGIQLFSDFPQVDKFLDVRLASLP